MEGYAPVAGAHLYSGQWERAVEVANKAILLSPRDPLLPLFYVFNGQAFIGLHKDEQSVEWFRRAMAVDPNYGPTPYLLAAALGLAGHEMEAHETLQGYLALPNIRLKSIAAIKAIPIWRQSGLFGYARTRI